MFVGRITRAKGVFDILEMARRVEAAAPGRVRWEICGGGPDLEELRKEQRSMGLESIVDVRGWTSLEHLHDVYARSHASIVPTRSNFTEGLPGTVAEAVLAGRPVITSSVVPALEMFQAACVQARTDDVQSYVEAILKLIDDREGYERLCRACPEFQAQFYDGEMWLPAVLTRLIKPLRDQKLGQTVANGERAAAASALE